MKARYSYVQYRGYLRYLGKVWKDSCLATLVLWRVWPLPQALVLIWSSTHIVRRTEEACLLGKVA